MAKRKQSPSQRERISDAIEEDGIQALPALGRMSASTVLSYRMPHLATSLGNGEPDLLLGDPLARDVACPLCGGRAHQRRVFDTNALVEQWRTHFGFDISDEVSHVRRFAEYACEACELAHYLPHAVGSEHLYRQLQTFPWYYGEDKWEHRMALKDVPQHADVLDVGCGVGAFLDVLRDRREARATGIDLSSEAVAIAQRLGRSASLGDLVNAVEGRIGEFDVVCAFQVLEHVADPRRFLQGCVHLLKPGGRLCVGVPNNDGYLGCQRVEDASLNLPPHHATRWGLRTLRMVARLFPVRLRRLRCEPLARWHVPEYLSAQLDTHHVSDEGVRRALRRFGRVALERAGLRRFVRGHTIYASYTRLPTPTDGSQDLDSFA